MDDKERRKRLAALPFSEKLKIPGEAPGPHSRDCCQRAEESGSSGTNAANNRREIEALIGFPGLII
jgi:hypothetical protein